jgi:hypothetical protein
MKSRIVFSGVLLFMSLLILACNDKITQPSDEITAKPIVKKTSTNYTLQSFNSSFPDTASLNCICRAYSNNYSEEMRNNILDYMKEEVDKLGEDINTFDRILSVTGCKNNTGYILPTYAEKAQYENREAWVFQITYGLNNSNLGHSKCFVFDAATLDTLTFKQCR